MKEIAAKLYDKVKAAGDTHLTRLLADFEISPTYTAEEATAVADGEAVEGAAKSDAYLRNQLGEVIYERATVTCTFTDTDVSHWAEGTATMKLNIVKGSAEYTLSGIGLTEFDRTARTFSIGDPTSVARSE